MTINVGGSSGGFEVETASGINIVAAGASGVLFTITPAEGKSIRLTYLTQTNSTGRESGLSLDVGTKNIFSGANLVGSSVNAGNLAINDISIGTSTLSGSISQSIQGKPDEAIVLTKDAGTTDNNVIYAYEVGQ